MNCYEAVWIFSGSARFFLGDQVIPLQQGDLLIHPPQVPYELRMDREGIGISFVLRTRYIQSRYTQLFSGNEGALAFFGQGGHGGRSSPIFSFMRRGISATSIRWCCRFS